MNDKNLKLPSFVLSVVDRLEQRGFEAWVVGGSIRDLILNRRPKDYDIATNAHPKEVATLFERTFETGIKHGTITVSIKDRNVEVTSFRMDGQYLDFRRPSEIRYVSTIEQDLARRDFTINAMAYSPKRGFKDPFFGLPDLKNGIIKAVGNPIERFNEDALRIIRTFRFASRFGFKIEERTLDAALKTGILLTKISIERIRDELFETLDGIKPSVIEPLIKSGALGFLGLSVSGSLHILDNLPNDKHLRFASLMYLCNCKNDVLGNFRLSKREAKELSTFLDLIYAPGPFDKQSLKQIMSLIPLDRLKLLLAARKTLLGECSELYIKWLDDIISSKEPYKISHLAVNGHDLIRYGIVKNKIGEALKFLLNAAIQEPSINKKEALLEKLKDFNPKDETLDK